MKPAKAVLFVATVLFAVPALADWQNEPANHHSGLPTTDPAQTIWDNDLAGWIGQYFTNGYSDMKFMFGQCYGGGFINDLQNFNNTVIDTAADYNLCAGYDPGPPFDDYATRWTNFMVGNNANASMKNAHAAGAAFEPADKPQYYSKPANLGDTLHLSNAGELSWHAILYVGTWNNNQELTQLKTMTQKMFNSLVNDYGYPAGDVNIFFGNDTTQINTPGANKMTATRENMRTTLERLGEVLDPHEEFFFWAYDHGVEVPEPASVVLLLVAVALARRAAYR